MMRARNLVLVLLLGVAVSGCGTPNVKRDYVLDTSGPTGLVLGSVTQSKSLKGHQGISAGVSGIDFNYRNLTTQKKGSVTIDAALMGPLFYEGDFSDAKGELFVIELEAGDYEFYSWNALQGAYTRVYPKKHFSVPFRVEAGQAAYIGEYNLDLIMGKNFFGIGIISGADFRVRDSSDRDLELVESRYPNIKREQIIIAVPEAREKSGPADRDFPLVIPGVSY